MSTDTIKSLEQMDAEVGARDKQPAKPEPINAERQIAADAARRESERLAKRKEIRAQIKQRAVLMQQVADLESQLRLLDQRADQAAAKHASATSPIQAKLATATGATRAKLLGELTDVNVALERELDAINRTRGPLTKQHRDVRTAAAGLPTEASLSGGDLASPKLLAEKFALEQRLAAAQQRTERARDWASAFERQLALASNTPTRPMMFGWHAVHGKVVLDFDRISLLTFRLAKWRSELTHAAAEQHAAQQALDEITREMIAE